MCKSLAEGGRRCRGSGPAVRRARYAVTKSAAARTLEKAISQNEIDVHSDAYATYLKARAAADMGRVAALSGDSDAAAEWALKAKLDMQRAAQQVAEATKRRIRVEETNRLIEVALERVNPKYEPGNHDYTENCSNVVQAYELRRRGMDVQAGPKTGFPNFVMEATWGGKYHYVEPGLDHGKSAVEAAFSEPGSRGIVYVAWKSGGAHVFNVENVGGRVRFVDGQPTPHVTDASHYFALSKMCGYLRIDDKPSPPQESPAILLAIRPANS
ncbi:toxin glutamine deamidase domain-containing protein [Streptomyces sp. NPDC002476]|uniref:toxin glutamine deamidase domain-containing protein n=1 Tax=Streptomyces sp. NPDC002476 TaxID=3364648 RepID=UPI0036C99576